jgi:hypothetical protein
MDFSPEAALLGNKAGERPGIQKLPWPVANGETRRMWMPESPEFGGKSPRRFRRGDSILHTRQSPNF